MRFGVLEALDRFSRQVPSCAHQFRHSAPGECSSTLPLPLPAGVLVQVLNVELRIHRVRNHQECELQKDLRDDARVSVLASAQCESMLALIRETRLSRVCEVRDVGFLLPLSPRQALFEVTILPPSSVDSKSPTTYSIVDGSLGALVSIGPNWIPVMTSVQPSNSRGVAPRAWSRSGPVPMRGRGSRAVCDDHSKVGR
jgi:hypothetical protein